MLRCFDEGRALSPAKPPLYTQLGSELEWITCKKPQELVAKKSTTPRFMSFEVRQEGSYFLFIKQASAPLSL